MRKSNERGITLVALVVTIVVLLILAGITITYVLSDNGIFGNARKAKTESAVGHVSDQVYAGVLAMQTDLYTRKTIPATTEGGTPSYEPDDAAVKSNLTTLLTQQGISGTPTITITGNNVSVTGTLTYDGVDCTVKVNTATPEFEVKAVPAATAE